MNNKNISFTVSLLFAIWFAATAYIWAYGAALIISYPFGIISLFIWRRLKIDGRNRNKTIPIILVTGLLISLIGLVMTR